MFLADHADQAEVKGEAEIRDVLLRRSETRSPPINFLADTEVLGSKHHHMANNRIPRKMPGWVQHSPTPHNNQAFAVPTFNGTRVAVLMWPDGSLGLTNTAPCRGRPR